eukprot:jgi/Tetstr1/424960/TSEL_001495.t1
MEGWLEERVNSELQKPHPTGPQLKELRTKQQTSEFYTREHVARLIRHQARTPWGRERHAKKVLCSAVHPPGCKLCKTCHFCRQKTVEPKTYCKCAELRGRMVGGRSRGYWCGPCLEMRVGENIDEVIHDEDWKCPVCRDLCNCSSVNCIRAKSGLEVTNQLWHEADSYGYKSVAHYLVLTHVKENAQAMPMLDLTGVRGRRPTEWGAAPEVAQGAARGRPQRRRGDRRLRLDAIARKAGEQISMEFQPPESLHFQAAGCKGAIAAMDRLRATFQAADDLEEEDDSGDRISELCRFSLHRSQASLGGGATAGQPARTDPFAAAAGRPEDARAALDCTLMPQVSKPPSGAPHSLPYGEREPLGDELHGVAPGPHPGLPSLGAPDAMPSHGVHAPAGRARGNSAAGGRSGVPSLHEGPPSKRPRLAPSTVPAGRPGGHSGEVPHPEEDGQRFAGNEYEMQPSGQDGHEAAGAETGRPLEPPEPPPLPAPASNERPTSPAAPRVQAPTSVHREGFFWDRLQVLSMWMAPTEEHTHALNKLGLSQPEVMAMVEAELLRYLPSAPVAIGGPDLAGGGTLWPGVQMRTHSDLRACTQILLALADFLPQDQVEPHVVRRLFGYEPFLDFGASDGVARAVLLDSAVQLLWKLKGTATGLATAAGYFLSLIGVLTAEMEAAAGLLKEATAYCGMTQLEEAELAHLRLPAVGMGQTPRADERVLALEGLLDTDARLLALILQHVLAFCAAGGQDGEEAFLDDRLAALLAPGCEAVGQEHRSLVLMILMAMMEGCAAALQHPMADEEMAAERRAAALGVLDRLQGAFLPRLEALVAIETPAWAAAGDVALLASPAQRQQLAGLGAQAMMVLGRLMGLRVAAGRLSWEELESAAMAPCSRAGFWEHSRPVHRNTALKLLAFALQSIGASASSSSSGLSVRLALLRHYVRAILERPSPNGTTRLFVRMVNEQPWVGAALHGCGGFDWELGRRSGSVGRLLQEYSEYTPALLEGLLQFLSSREAEVMAEAVDSEAGVEDCCRWAACTAPVLLSAVRMVGPQKLHSFAVSTSGRVSVARWQAGAKVQDSLLTGILEHVTCWLAPSAMILQRGLQQPSAAEDDEARAQARANARDQLKGTVLGQMSPLMDALQAVGAPGRFEPPLRPSQDTLLRLCVVAFRAALETASGEAVPGPVDEAAFEVLADAISPAPGDEPLSQRTQDRRRLAHFFLCTCGVDLLESSRLPLSYCARNAVNLLNFALKFFGQPFLRSGVLALEEAGAGAEAVTAAPAPEVLRQLFPPLVYPLLATLAPAGQAYKGAPSLSTASKVYELLGQLVRMHPALLVPPQSTGAAEPELLGAPLQGGPLQTAEAVDARRFRETMQVFLATVLQSVCDRVASTLGASPAQGEGGGGAEERSAPASLATLSANAPWRLQKLLGQGRPLAEGYASEAAPPRGLARVPRDRRAPAVPSGLEAAAARAGLAMLAAFAAAGGPGAAWVGELALPPLRRLLSASAPRHPLRASYAAVLAALPPPLAGPLALPLPTSAASQLADRNNAQASAPAAVAAASGSSGAEAPRRAGAASCATPPTIGTLPSQPALSQATQSTQPAHPLRQVKVGGNAVVPLGELGGWVNSTVCLRGVVVNRFPTTGTQLQNGIQFTKVSLLDDSTASEVVVLCARDVARQVARLLDAAPTGEPHVLLLPAVDVKTRSTSGGLMLSAKNIEMGAPSLDADDPHSRSLQRWFSAQWQRGAASASASAPAATNINAPGARQIASGPAVAARGGAHGALPRTGLASGRTPASASLHPNKADKGGAVPRGVTGSAGRKTPAPALQQGGAAGNAAKLDKLLAMGFSAATARQALAVSGGNIERAIAALVAKR